MKLERNDVIGIMVLDPGTSQPQFQVGATFTAKVENAKKSTIQISIHADLPFSLRNGRLKRIPKARYGPTVWKFQSFADTQSFRYALVTFNKVQQ